MEQLIKQLQQHVKADSDNRAAVLFATDNGKCISLVEGRTLLNTVAIANLSFNEPKVIKMLIIGLVSAKSLKHKHLASVRIALLYRIIKWFLL